MKLELNAFENYAATIIDSDIATAIQGLHSECDLAEAERFLHMLDPSTTKFEFRTFDDNKGRGDIKLTKVFYGTLVEHAAKLKRLNERGAGIFVTINEPDGKGRKTANIVKVRAVSVDLDGAPLGPVMRPERMPHIVVESSPGRWQAYWLVDGLPLNEFGDVQRKLIEMFEGDQIVVDLPRVMRLPGFFHCKDEPFQVRIVQSNNDKPYPARVFERKKIEKRTQAGHEREGDATKLRTALRKVPADDYNIWVRVGAALYYELGEDGWNIFEDWSANSDKHRPAQTKRKWEECKSITGIRAGTIYRLADQYSPGWRADALEASHDVLRRAAANAKADTTTTRDNPSADATSDQSGRQNDDNAGGNAGQALPVIQIKAGQEKPIAQLAQKILVARGAEIYQFGSKLVRPIVEETDAAHESKTMVARLREITPAFLNLELCGAIRFERYDSRGKKYVQIRAPHQITADILALEGFWAFPTINGLITAPTMRPDGSLLVKPGYDPSTRLLLLAAPPMPPIPSQLTKEDALAALKTLEEPIEEFPFDSDVSQAVALSALITPVVRGAFKVTPMHNSRAAVASTGKSYLWDITAAIATGRRMPVISVGRNEEETEKRLGAALITGQVLISIDNVNGDLGGDFLCQAIERPILDVRVLGKSENVRVEAFSTSIFATGNNITIIGDLGRRVITTILDAKVEQPELRKFKKNPFDMVMADRGKYIAACLTICRAYVVAGRPDAAVPLASFEGWSNTVRSALIWLGKADPIRSMQIARAEDPERTRLANLITEWSETIGVGEGYKVTQAELLSLANKIESGYAGERVHPDLFDAVRAAVTRGRGSEADKGEQIDKTAFTNFLRLKKNIPIGDLRITNEITAGRRTYWWLESLTGKIAEPRKVAAKPDDQGMSF